MITNNNRLGEKPSESLLVDFFVAIKEDQRIRIGHIGLYATLVQYWIGHGRLNPICAPPMQIMEIAKVSAKSTYLRYLRELHDYGYIKYQPSFNPKKHSRIRLLELPDLIWNELGERYKPGRKL